MKHEDFENAYVYYLKGCSIMLEYIGRHADFTSILKDPFYMNLRKRTSNEILTILEDIRCQLQIRSLKTDEVFPPNSSGLETTDHDLQMILDRFPDISTLNELPPVPTHLPSNKIKTSEQHAPSKTSRQEQGWKFSKQPRKDLSVSYDARLDGSTKDGRQTPGIQLPPLSNYVFPEQLGVEPHELASWLIRKDNPPSVLLLDARPRDMFSQACIKHKWIVQIEPLVLREGVTSQKIQDSLVLNPEAEQQLFCQRHQFDLVVIYDQITVSMNALSTPIRQLKAGVFDMEYSKKLRRPPMILLGGFQAWVDAIGHRGVYSFSSNKLITSSTADRAHVTAQHLPGSSKDAFESISPLFNHSLYDYFNQNQREQRFQSMGGHMSHAYYSRSYYGDAPAIKPTPALDHRQVSTDRIEGKPMNLPQRRNTFIDNPFHGFTTTSSKFYDVPPIPAKPTRPLPKLPSSPKASTPQPPPLTVSNNTNVTPKYPDSSLAITISRQSTSTDTDGRVAPVSNSSFSQLGGVLIGTTGLKNLGNTCYMNSIIQCLSGTIPFARYFISGTYKHHISKQNPLGTGGVLADSFAELLQVMWSESYNFISPVTFREALVRFAPQYSGTEQQDSQEFLNFLLDGLHEDLNTSLSTSPPSMEDPEEESKFEKLPDMEASALAWEKYLQNNASVVISLFQGQYRSRLTCLTCKTTSTTYNTFMSLSLPIPTKKHKLSSSVSLYQCLDYFVKDEVLDKADSWHCPNCKKLRKTTKTLTLSRLPDVLLIHLKRFSLDGPFRNKLETVVDFPTKNLDLSRYIPKTMTPPNSQVTNNYDLYAVSNHFGSLTGGHYTACVRNGYRGEWHNFDDTRFSVCDESKVKSRAAYNLFYVRSAVK
ncbi:cysteine proteinase [Hesseltinella vesiculosa]|uniref:Ubiquitin carboxyl-terminal hydrolase n=1 Tax=Hesseltinella vesiculosa TaxID=101127 RepID=A0A1X2G4Z7_9FUNG|nr:cysteine proteinase [Hesseltinella vesiculosa]